MSKNADAEKNNPCLKEQNMTYQCLNKNNYDREVCEPYFVNYNNCKDFWGSVSLARRRKGITPHLPDVEDRPKIKEEYMKTRPDR
ncbi:coiled-coil-helix-coiled-coil-helix domain-containing protein 7 [Bradysia coprophila]|uniref:coiled-coil-helix-coiled-coil-helix domain-containing protein 7 n=1 Tax=Bradysia coprophila TaxID=38358 RepID=UPI00187DAB3A|nr:coiled-coil-helix-coiled-coil-helix domain-containing protein 7 [Bradysia coprophila]